MEMSSIAVAANIGVKAAYHLRFPSAVVGDYSSWLQELADLDAKDCGNRVVTEGKTLVEWVLAALQRSELRASEQERHAIMKALKAIRVIEIE